MDLTGWSRQWTLHVDMTQQRMRPLRLHISFAHVGELGLLLDSSVDRFAGLTLNGMDLDLFGLRTIVRKWKRRINKTTNNFKKHRNPTG